MKIFKFFQGEFFNNGMKNRMKKICGSEQSFVAY